MCVCVSGCWICGSDKPTENQKKRETFFGFFFREPMRDSQAEYEPAPRDELEAEDDETLERKERRALERRRRDEAQERVRAKLEALFWVAASGCVLWYGDGKRDFFSVLVRDGRIARGWLAASLASFALNLCIYLYLAVWLGLVKGSTEDWNVSSPYAIPAGTLLGIFSFFTFSIAAWPVWYVLAPVIAFVLLLGFVSAFHFVPSFGNKED